jgi:hypothetical protein
MASFLISNEPSDEEHKHGGPSIAQAWDYFYKHTLPRRIRGEDHEGRSKYARASESDITTQLKSTELYPVWGTSLDDLIHFGSGGCDVCKCISTYVYLLCLCLFKAIQCRAGVSLYFRQLLSLAALCLVYSLITSPTIAWYAGDDYSPSRQSMSDPLLAGEINRMYVNACSSCESRSIHTSQLRLYAKTTRRSITRPVMTPSARERTLRIVSFILFPGF